MTRLGWVIGWIGVGVALFAITIRFLGAPLDAQWPPLALANSLLLASWFLRDRLWQ